MAGDLGFGFGFGSGFDLFQEAVNGLTAFLNEDAIEIDVSKDPVIVEASNTDVVNEGFLQNFFGAFGAVSNGGLNGFGSISVSGGSFAEATLDVSSLGSSISISGSATAATGNATNATAVDSVFADAVFGFGL